MLGIHVHLQRKNMKRFVFAALAGVSVMPSAIAQVINPSFEDPFIAGNFVNLATIPGWSLNTGGEAGVWVLPASLLFNTNAPDGRQIFFSNGPSLAQQISNTLTEGTHTFFAQAGRRGDGFAGSFAMRMYAGGTVANGAVTGGTLLGTTNFDHTTIATNSFTPISVSYTAAAGDPLLGQLLSVQFVRTSGVQVNFDAVTYNDQVVPEPATLGLLALGGLLMQRRRK